MHRSYLHVMASHQTSRQLRRELIGLQISLNSFEGDPSSLLNFFGRFGDRVSQTRSLCIITRGSESERETVDNLLRVLRRFDELELVTVYGGLKHLTEEAAQEMSQVYGQNRPARIELGENS